VTVEADGLGRFGQEVEAAAYFCALEALQNASKYAGASSVRIELCASAGVLACAVRD
jgi:signal transduction histidine kinase